MWNILSLLLFFLLADGELTFWKTKRSVFFFSNSVALVDHFSKTSQVNRIGNKKLRWFPLVQKLRKFPGLVKEYYIMSIILRLMLYSNICFFFAVRSNKEYSAGSKWYMDQIHTVSTILIMARWDIPHHLYVQNLWPAGFPNSADCQGASETSCLKCWQHSDIFSLWKFGGIFKWSQNHQPQQSNKSWWNMICWIFHG